MIPARAVFFLRGLLGDPGRRSSGARCDVRSLDVFPPRRGQPQDRRGAPAIGCLFLVRHHRRTDLAARTPRRAGTRTGVEHSLGCLSRSTSTSLSQGHESYRTLARRLAHRGYLTPLEVPAAQSGWWQQCRAVDNRPMGDGTLRRRTRRLGHVCGSRLSRSRGRSCAIVNCRILARTPAAGPDAAALPAARAG